jgi:hypothetical protein
MTKKESVITAMVSWNMDTLVKNWNTFVKKAKDLDKNNAFKEVYPMSQFSAQCKHLSPDEIAESVTSKGHAIFYIMDKYFFMRGGKFESFNTIREANCPISFDWLANYIMENGDCGFTEIDNNILVKGFIQEYYPEMIGNAKFFNKVMNIDDADFLMDDWDDIHEEIEHKGEYLE